MNRRRAAVAGLLVAALVAGVAVLATRGGAAGSKAEISGGTPNEQTLLRKVVAGMQPTVITKIEITGSGHVVALHFSAPSGRWSPAFWQEGLVGAAFRDRANAAGDSLDVLNFGREANGVPLAHHGPPTPLPPAKPGDAAAAKRLFERAAAKIGASFDQLRIYHPDGIAVAATLKSGHPASFLVHRMKTFLHALGVTSNLDGTYVTLVDGRGQTVWQTSYDERIWEGSVGSRPDLEGCSPVSNFGNPPPPCPAK